MKNKFLLFLLPVMVLASCNSHVHTYSDEWTAFDKDGHAHMATCEHKSAHTPIEPHDYEKTVIYPTQTSLGYDHYECKICHFTYDDNYVAPEVCAVSYDLAPSLRKAESEKTDPYHFTFNYKNAYFRGDAKAFHKELALLSNGKSMMCNSEVNMQLFYSSLFFDRVESHYVEFKTENTVSFALAHRKVDDFDLVSVVISGHDYGMEWANNADIGSLGDHKGFSERASDVYEALKSYLATYTNYKLWISGYSRGGAIANVLSHYILSKDEVAISKENMYVYTFECPLTLDSENALPYENVFNVVYSGDFVTHVAPKKYGFARCGIDIDLYKDTETTNALLTEFDSDIEIPNFVEFSDLVDSSIKITNETDAVESIIGYILRQEETSSEDYLFFPTREAYVSKVQSALKLGLSIFFGLPEDIKSRMIEAAKQDPLTIISSSENIYNFLKPYLDEAEFPYIDSILRDGCTVIWRLIVTNSSLLISVYLANNVGNELIRSVKLHYPEVGYVLLSAYNPEA